MTQTYQHPTAGQIIIGASRAASRVRPLPSGQPPAAVGTIPDQIITQGGGPATVALASYFSGTSLSFALQSAVTGVSISGSTRTRPLTMVAFWAGTAAAWVLPIAGAFANGQKFAFGRGGATGIIRGDEDSTDLYHLNYPGVDLGFYKLEIVPIEPMPTAAILTAAGIT